jgi:DNA repair protein RadA/Sms
VPKGRSVFRCTECGADQPKWGGKCDACGAWNSLVEEAVGRLSGAAVRGVPTGPPPIRLTDLKQSAIERWKTGLAEFDFVLGGGIVPGSVTLVGGEPGIGKSTLLMQCAARLEHQGIATLYVSGEESPDQLRLRADRLQEDAGGIHVLGETRLESIIHHATQLKSSVVLLDSVQTTYTEELEGAPGNVGQVRECAALLMCFAKES